MEIERGTLVGYVALLLLVAVLCTLAASQLAPMLAGGFQEATELLRLQH
jgi:hypothetical protein